MSGDAFLDKGIEKAEIDKCLRKLKNNKTGVSDWLVLKYGGSGMVTLKVEQRQGCEMLITHGCPYGSFYAFQRSLRSARGDRKSTKNLR